VVHKVNGKGPLQISKGEDWRRLNNVRTMNLGTAMLKIQKITEGAIYISNSSFRLRYNIRY